MSASVSGVASTSLTTCAHVSQFSFFLVTQFSTLNLKSTTFQRVELKKKTKKNTLCCFQNINLELPRQSSDGKYKQENKVFHAAGDSWAWRLLVAVCSYLTHFLSSRSLIYSTDSLRSLDSLVSRSDLLIQQEPDSEVVMAPVY